jgi:tetratricopeptide (TPR) repeat protein
MKRLLSLAVAAFAVVVLLPGPAAAQAPEPKDKFVSALRQFLEAIAGQYGDEGPKAGSALDSMEQALAEWDQGIQAYRDQLVSQAQSAEVRAALGLIYLDRRRIDDALREFSAAIKLDPKRADIFTLQGFAYSLVDKPTNTIQAFAKAAALDPGDATMSYRLGQYSASRDHAQQADKALQQFRDTQRKQLFEMPAGRAEGARFIRVDLLRQTANVAPIFPPALYAGGLAALRSGRYDEAVVRLRVAAGDDPLNTFRPTAEFSEGVAALRLGRLKAALEHLRGAVKSAPDAAEAHRILGMSYWADEQFDKGVEEFETAIGLRPDDERSRVALADLLAAAGRPAEAEQAFKDAIRAVPGSGQAHYNLGRLYDAQQRPSEAAQAFQAAADFNPLVGQDYLYETIARLHMSQPDFDKAIDAATKRIEVNPNNPEAHRALGEMYLGQGRHDETLTEFLAALLINPTDAASYGGIAQVDLRTGRYTEAVAAARRTLEIDAGHTAAQYALATALIRLGRTQEGTIEMDRFQQLQAQAQAREQRGWDLKMLKQEASFSLTKEDYDSAIAALQKAVEYQPDDASTFLNLGLILKKTGRHWEAIENFNKSLALKASTDVHRLLAETYEAIGQIEESRTHRANYERLKEERLQKGGWSR